MEKLQYISLSVIVKKGFGTYNYMIGYCKKCRSFNIHTALPGISFEEKTCEKGHMSGGYLSYEQFARNKKRIIELSKKLLKKYG